MTENQEVEKLEDTQDKVITKPETKKVTPATQPSERKLKEDLKKANARIAELEKALQIQEDKNIILFREKEAVIREHQEYLRQVDHSNSILIEGINFALKAFTK